MQKIQEVVQSPAIGITVGGGTAAYSIFAEIVTVAQMVGVLCGSILSTCLLIEFIARKLRERRGSKS